jgi:hypothetical protein
MHVLSHDERDSQRLDDRRAILRTQAEVLRLRARVARLEGLIDKILAERPRRRAA